MRRESTLVDDRNGQSNPDYAINVKFHKGINGKKETLSVKLIQWKYKFKKSG